MAVNLKIVSQVVASGTPGPVGKSAYQIAVDNGFQGTESEWLKELHPFKGWFDSVSALEETHPTPSVGEYAYVKGATSSDPAKIYECSTEGSWLDSGRTVDTSDVQTFGSGEDVNDVNITGNVSDIVENSEKLPTAGAVAVALGHAEFSSGEKIKDVGIDSEPIVGSENLVKSKGVYEKISTIIAEKNYTDNKKVIGPSTDPNAGEIGDSTASFISAKIPVVFGDKIYWQYAETTNITRYMGVYDSEDNPLTTVQTTSGTHPNAGAREFKLNFESSTNASYIIATFVKTGTYTPIIKKNGVIVWTKKENGDIKRIEEEIEQLEGSCVVGEDIVDNLSSSDSDKVLSAKQGKILNEKIEPLIAEKNYTDNKQISRTDSTHFSIVDSENKYISANIPFNHNDVVRWYYAASKRKAMNVALCNNSDEPLWVYISGDVNTSDSDGFYRQVTLSSDIYSNGGYLIVTFYKESGFVPKVVINNEIVWTKEEDGDIKRIENKIESYHPEYTDYGYVGNTYPEEIKDISKFLAEKRLQNRFQFLHISDNHSTDFNYAQEFVDFCDAKFLINTGDMVYDKFTDGASHTIAQAIIPNKPTYITLGNHDCSYAPDYESLWTTFFGDANTEGTLNYHNQAKGGIVVGDSLNPITYYKVDYSEENIRCLMIDINEGRANYQTGPANLIAGTMSPTQINWIATQLQDAIDNGLHVCIFSHELPMNFDNSSIIEEFRDRDNLQIESVCSNLEFLANMVDAFINCSQVSFSYNGNNYNFSFIENQTLGKGKFVSWFAGHTHSDMAGKLYNHPLQFGITVCRPNGGNYHNDKCLIYKSSSSDNPVCCNYVTVDTSRNLLSVYRIGCQDTISATKRKSFYLFY